MFRRSNTGIGLKTYEAGLIQAKAHRVLTAYLSKRLKTYSLSVSEWGLLGQITQTKQSRTTELATGLGVEVPRVTKMVDHLEELGLVARTTHSGDSRVRMIELTPEGAKKVSEIERMLRADMRQFLSGISIPELLTYLKVLQKISELGDTK